MNDSRTTRLPFWQAVFVLNGLWYIFCTNHIELHQLKITIVLFFNYEYNEQQNRKPTAFRY